MDEITQGTFAPSKGVKPKKKNNKGKYKKQYRRKVSSNKPKKVRNNEARDSKNKKL